MCLLRPWDVGRIYYRSRFAGYSGGWLMSVAATIVNGPDQCRLGQCKQEVNIQWQQGGAVPPAAVQSPARM